MKWRPPNLAVRLAGLILKHLPWSWVNFARRQLWTPLTLCLCSSVLVTVSHFVDRTDDTTLSLCPFYLDHGREVDFLPVSCPLCPLMEYPLPFLTARFREIWPIIFNSLWLENCVHILPWIILLLLSWFWPRWHCEQIENWQALLILPQCDVDVGYTPQNIFVQPWEEISSPSRSYFTLYSATFNFRLKVTRPFSPFSFLPTFNFPDRSRSSSSVRMFG